MNISDLTFTFSVDHTPEEVFNAFNNVRGWWSQNLEGHSEKLNDEFIYQYKDLHTSKQKLVEVIPNAKVVWLVTEGYLSFVSNQTEWIGTKIILEIERKGNKTEFKFTHAGLNAHCECYEACNKGWSYYLNESLIPLITSGKGKPNWKESETKSAIDSIN